MEFAIQNKLKIEDRVAEQQALATIKNNPILALVELITNCDDSYRRLESAGFSVDGNIIIELIRKRKEPIINVIDYAEGFTDKTMDERVGSYGGDTSGFTTTEAGRGYWGRGLKEAMIAMGYGSVESIKDNFIHKCVLEHLNYKRNVPIKITNEIRKKMDIKGNGTIITLKAINKNISIPYYENLKHSLEFYYSLRDIVSNNNRRVVLIEKDSRGRIKKQETLSYIAPKGLLYTRKPIKIPDYEKAILELELYRANDPLSGYDEGPLRENGVLICTKGAVLDITLSRKFEGNHLATKLYGHGVCDYLDYLLRIKKEPVIRSDRGGLDWHHPFVRSLETVLSHEISNFVTEEEKKEKESEKKLENEKTRKRYESALPILNKIAKDELGDESEGEGKGENIGKSPMLPKNGFDFIPDYVQLVVEKESTLTLKTFVPKVVPSGSTVSIVTDTKEIVVIDDKIKLDEKDRDPNNGIVTAHVRVIGKQVGAEGIITAQVNDLKAEILVKVISRRKVTPPSPPGKKSGLFNHFEFSSSADPHQRVKYERTSGKIIIATKAPSVEMYFGPDGEGQEESHCQVMLAELVVEAVCREISRRKIESGKEPFLGEASEAMSVVHNRLINKYATKIHNLLVEKKYHR